MYPNILNEVSQNNWAMLPDSFNGILKGIDGSLSFVDYKLFHKLDEEVKATILSFLGTQTSDTSYTRIKDDVGSLFIDGPIVPRVNGFVEVSGLASIDKLTQEFLALEANEAIEKILLVIDSPGGSVKGISEFVQIISESEKPVEAINLGIMASAAYWIGSAADRVYSVDTGLIGGIGTILNLPNPEDKSTVIVSEQSPNKKMDIKTKQGRADAQRIVNDLAAIFINSVAKNRGVKAKEVLSQYGKGSVFVAEDAGIRGMIDDVISLKDYMGSPNLENADLDVNMSDKDKGTVDVHINKQVSKIKKEDKQKAKLTLRNFPKQKTLEAITMENLDQVIAEYPAIAREVTAIKAKAFSNGQQTIQAKIDRVLKFLTCETYGKSIKELACKVLKGECDVVALESAVTVVDAMKVKEEIQAASEDTAEIGESAAAGNLDIAVKEEQEFEASLEYQKANI